MARALGEHLHDSRARSLQLLHHANTANLIGLPARHAHRELLVGIDIAPDIVRQAHGSISRVGAFLKILLLHLLLEQTQSSGHTCGTLRIKTLQEGLQLVQLARSL